MSFTRFDVDQIQARMAYSLLIDSVVPRPIAFITTRGMDGSFNAAPFSFFNAVCSSPVVISISFTPKRDGSIKDTLRNIRETKEFVVNILSEDWVQAMNQASAEYPYGVSELQQVGMTELDSDRVSPPRVKESAVHLECRLYQEVVVGAGLGSAVLVLGEVLAFHISESVLVGSPERPRISVQKLKPVSRLGGLDYGVGIQPLSMDRPELKGTI